MRTFLLSLVTTSALLAGDLSQDINAFSFALSQPLTKWDANAVYSPFSLFTCLSMAASGAETSTKKAMETALQWSQNRSQIAAALELFPLKSVNAIFAEQDTTFLPSYTALVETSYHAKIQAIDFSKLEESLQIINTWVSNETNQKIDRLLQLGDIDSSTRILLVNALYFRDGWRRPFDKKSTEKKPFFIDGTTSQLLPMMHQVHTFRYFDDVDVQVALIPLLSLKGIRPSLVVILPKIASDFSRIETEMTPQTLHDYLTASTPKRLDLQLPSFCLRKRYDLRQALSALGMGIAFTNSADFSAIDGLKDLYLSKALHESFFAVNEEGIEAAAATSVAIGVTSAAPSKESPILFNANHPFLFFLVDEESEIVLFAGKLTDPKL